MPHRHATAHLERGSWRRGRRRGRASTVTDRTTGACGGEVAGEGRAEVEVEGRFGVEVASEFASGLGFAFGSEFAFGVGFEFAFGVEAELAFGVGLGSGLALGFGLAFELGLARAGGGARARTRAGAAFTPWGATAREGAPSPARGATSRPRHGTATDHIAGWVCRGARPGVWRLACPSTSMSCPSRAT